MVLSMIEAMSDPRPTAPAARTALDWAPVESGTRAPPVSRDDEGELCARVAQGDNAAFAILVERYQHRVFGFCARMLHDRAEAEDVAQDVFLTVYRNAGEFRGEAAFTTWLFRIARNQTLNRIKYLDRRGRSMKKPLEDDFEERSAQWATDASEQPDQLYSDGQTAQMVRDAIAELQEEHRSVVVLRDIEDLSYEEISDITGLPLGTVKSRIHRARSALARRLKRLFS